MAGWNTSCDADLAKVCELKTCHFSSREALSEAEWEFFDPKMFRMHKIFPSDRNHTHLEIPPHRGKDGAVKRYLPAYPLWLPS